MPAEPTPAPVEAPTSEELTAQLEKAVHTWEAKAEEESHSAEGKVSREMLYRATEEGMRKALNSMEEHQHDAEAQEIKEAEEKEENEGGKPPPP